MPRSTISTFQLFELFPGEDTARVSTLRAVPELDGARPSREDRTDGGALWIDCGRREGYMQETVTRLLELAKIAGERNAVVSYA